jgi:NADH:ubiquinone reductase (non-electrogenic)
MYKKLVNQKAPNTRGLSPLSPDTALTQICILGGGFGGLYTALYLQRYAALRKTCQVTLVDQNTHFLFTPLLYELMTGELKRWEIAPCFTQLLAKTNVQFCQATIQTVNLNARQVVLKDSHPLRYDYLILSTGKESGLDHIPGAADHVYPFRTLADAQRLHRRLCLLESSEQDLIRIAIIGAGPSGVELAGKLGDRLKQRGQIHLIDRGNDILKTFTPDSRITAYRALAARNIQVELEVGIEQMRGDRLVLRHYEQVTELPTDLVLWTAGGQLPEWVQNLPCLHSKAGKLLTSSTLQLIDYPEVFALGDLAEIQAGNQPGTKIPATAQAAYQQADCAAHNLRAKIQGGRLKPFRYLHLGEMITLGTDSAAVTSFGISLRGRLACLVRRLVYLQRLPTLHHRLRVVRHQLVRWWRGRTSQKQFPKAADSSVSTDLGQLPQRGVLPVRSEPNDLENSAWRSPDLHRSKR